MPGAAQTKSLDILSCIKAGVCCLRQESMSKKSDRPDTFDDASPTGPGKPADNAPPPGPERPATPDTPDGPTEARTVLFEGTVQLYTANMPESSFVDFSKTGTHPVFACCWINGKRGASSYVTFPSDGGPGVYSFGLAFRDGDPNLVKVQFLMRMQDPGTGIRRTVHLCCGCAKMDSMLKKQEIDTFGLADQFMEGDYAKVSLRVCNAHEFVDRPLRLRESALIHLPVFNGAVDGVDEGIAKNMAMNKTKFSRGTEDMRSGKSRFVPNLLLFVALSLGTPAYVFMSPCLQP
jgi:hypothetical protein